MSIPEDISLRKGFFGAFRKDIAILLVVLITSFLSFFLGFLAGKDTSRAYESSALFLEKNTTSSAIEVFGDPEGRGVLRESIPEGGHVVASKNGSKYYLPWCGGVNTIKEENKIWFASAEEAKIAGYTPATNCKGNL